MIEIPARQPIFYLAHPLDERKDIRRWELDFEKRIGINLINPFYDVNRADMKLLDKGRKERYEQQDSKELVERDLGEILKSDGVVAFVTGALSYGTLMEMFFTKLKGKPLYSIVSNGHENHPWLKYCSTEIFKSKEEFEKWISLDCPYCKDKMYLVGRNLEQKFKMFECKHCEKTWMETDK
jgi:nucleoside 2-deoxyribosyltransferase